MKFAASIYLLPVQDVQLAGVFQTNPGATYNANVTYTNAPVPAELGRPLAHKGPVTVDKLRDAVFTMRQSGEQMDEAIAMS